MDQETLPPNKRELLKQISSPHNPKEESLGSSSHKPSPKPFWSPLSLQMSIQEYELLKEDDEQCLRKYRKQCMREMHERLSFGPRFNGVHELDSGEAFLEVIEKEHRLTVVVVHIYKAGVKGCEVLDRCLDCLAAQYPSVKFCRINAAVSGAGEHFSDNVLPAVLVYKAGEMLGNFLAITQHFSDEFLATDVEAFLTEYGLLPEKDFRAAGDEADVE
ncbi:hypothetical protein QTP70_022498 [Hemibagrus guttatus]|uniref:Phosducin domain-containing protein n=1 Tax=Hemibagrus guttatus TaxID=175788 RepID=A0AAE0UT45_9TELE|nr:hypothetical protein QTP70_022498 [Hemibagrus guttatus]KAK3542599.1 hypothetical protein QTP86_031296 [Hemibagrus guttatus]